MINYIKITLGILLALGASRFIPHPPNFTSLLALSFYVPAILGIRYIPALLISFVITDLIIGLHSTTFFTWGSVLIVGLLSKYIYGNTFKRILGSFTGVILFFIITNFGVWLNGSYGYNLEGLIACYILAIPFFGNTVIATFLFSLIIETVYRYRYLLKKLTP